MNANRLTDFVFAAGRAIVERKLERVRSRFLIDLTTTLLVVVAAGFALAAFIVWLAGVVGTVWSLMIVAAFLVIFAGAIRIISRNGAPRGVSRRRTSR